MNNFTCNLSLFLALIIPILLLTGCPEPGPHNGGTDNVTLLTLSEETTYQITITVTVTNVDAVELTRISVFIPVPQNNVYQEVADVDVNGGTLLDIENSDCKYARFVKTDNFPGHGESYDCSISYDVTLHHLHADTSTVETLYPYDTESTDYTRYQGNRGASSPYYIDIENTDIVAIGDTLWMEAGGNGLEYARLCYEHVAMNYDYVNPYTGLHTISDIMTAGGGDCGNLSSLFISLLRYKNIPAKHIITVRPNETFHIWADFYLEKYGWIPVDVNAALNDYKADGSIDGNFFGDITLANNGIVVMKDCYFKIIRYDGDTGGIYAPLFQDCGLSTARASGTVTKSFSITAVEL
jgi:hypothetical protein